MILAGDIGGTNVRLAVFREEDGKLVLEADAKYASREMPGLEHAIDRFLRGRDVEVTAAGFGVAGPVRDGRCEATNLAWVVDAASVARHLGLRRAGLVNDLVANATGLFELASPDFEVLNVGEEDPEGNAALISAGTGLGEGLLVRDGGGFRALPSEGGHASFAPRDHEEIELLKRLMARYGHVSFERVLSGPGFVNLYAFERAISGEPEPAWMHAEIQAAGDPAPVVAAAALAHRDRVAARALHRFVRIYGAEAGNLALKALATGGVYIGGGIAPKILPALKEAFFPAFCDKGRYAPILARMPVKVVLNDRCALLGAARVGVNSAAARAKGRRGRKKRHE